MYRKENALIHNNVYKQIVSIEYQQPVADVG